MRHQTNDSSSYMVVKYHSPSLEKFLVDKCSGNITLFLKVIWHSQPRKAE